MGLFESDGEEVVLFLLDDGEEVVLFLLDDGEEVVLFLLDDGDRDGDGDGDGDRDGDDVCKGIGWYTGAVTFVKLNDLV